MKTPSFFYRFLFFLVCVVMLIGAIKGGSGNPIPYQKEKNIDVGGPFEASNSNARYALTEAIVTQNTFFFDDDLARFSAPDLVHFGNRYFSIFPPGVALIGVPFYHLGQQWGIPQVSTYSVTMLFALFNVILIAGLARRLGANSAAAMLSGFLFLFATNALSYSATFTQHHFSTFVLLSATLLSTNSPSLLNSIGIGMLFGFGLLIDIPNAYMMTPAVLYAFSKHFSVFQTGASKSIRISPWFIGIAAGSIPLIGLFLWYNAQLTGNPFVFGQSIGRSDYPPAKVQTVSQGQPPVGFSAPFTPRRMIDGLYILTVSDERGWLYYSPILFLGVAGLLNTIRKKSTYPSSFVSVSIIAIVLVSYAMFHDPWGGWAFGPRYMIPAAAFAAAGIGAAFSLWSRRIWFALVISISGIYSLGVSALGALTTNLIPPKIEAILLPEPIPYTYALNIQSLQNGNISSLLYNQLFHIFSTPINYYFGYLFTLMLILFLLLIAAYMQNDTEKTVQAVKP